MLQELKTNRDTRYEKEDFARERDKTETTEQTNKKNNSVAGK